MKALVGLGYNEWLMLLEEDYRPILAALLRAQRVKSVYSGEKGVAPYQVDTEHEVVIKIVPDWMVVGPTPSKQALDKVIVSATARTAEVKAAFSETETSDEGIPF